MAKSSLARRTQRGLYWYVGQWYGCVVPGLIFTKYLYRGLKRDMLVGSDGKAAKKKLAATWQQPRDARYTGGAQSGRIVYHNPPSPGSVFAVYISPNEMLDKFPDIYGWAEHWCWIDGDLARPGAPIEWDSRYDDGEIWAAPTV